jgi:TM2 domain-containing membrane protein YozV
MESQKVDMFIMANSKFFESHQVFQIREQLLQLDDSKWGQVQTLQFKDPTTSLIVSLVAGSLGIDRFLIGDTGLGIGKLLTCGGFGIWAIIDWFLIMGATREKNMTRLQTGVY